MGLSDPIPPSVKCQMNSEKNYIVQQIQPLILIQSQLEDIRGSMKNK